MNFRRLTHDDVVSASVWAKENAGEDDPVDVMTYKLLQHMAWNAGTSSEYHERTQTKIEALMADIESRFVVSGQTEEF